MDDDAFRELMKEGCRAHREYLTRVRGRALAERLYYCSVDYSDSLSFEAVADRLKEREAGHSTSSNRLIYLSTPPSLYPDIIENIGSTSLGVNSGRMDKDRHRKAFWKRSEERSGIGRVITQVFFRGAGL